MSQFILKEVLAIFSKPEIDLKTIFDTDDGKRVVEQLRQLSSKIKSWSLQKLDEEKLGLSVPF